MIEQIQEALIKHPELIKSQYRWDDSPLAGHCYVASEVYYYLHGKEEGFIPHCMKIAGGTHWFLRHKNTGEILDLTKSYLLYEYNTGRHVPFLSKEPSRRAKIIFKEMGM